MLQKLYFYEVENSARTIKIIIGLQNKVAQINPGDSHFLDETDIVDFEIVLSDEDVKTVINIVKDGLVSEWDRS